MSGSFSSFILAYHGCNRSIGEKILSGKDKLKPSRNKYDWLGNGAYFWESDPARAFEYADHIKKNPGKSKSIIQDPFVIGAIIDLGNCLNLLQYDHLQIVKQGYFSLESMIESINGEMPRNKAIEDGADLLLRPLDCAVIELLHASNRENGKPEFDTVRGVFFEGNHLYPNAGFKEKNHIQICVRTPRSIKGYFRPIDANEGIGFDY
ncbi:MAG: hypothetical protein JF616_14605 [Fibrobacteres bacterium]|jgi:hypothetical protein|nr:hypothetical protein [Fibrobacterota bacterium]